MEDSLTRMERQIHSGTFPGNYVFLPVVLDASALGDPQLHQAATRMNQWYHAYCRDPDPSVQRRQNLISFLMRRRNIGSEEALELLHLIALDARAYQALAEEADPCAAQKNDTDESAQTIVHIPRQQRGRMP